MANRRVLVKRRKAIQNIRKITRTMQLIATARFQAAFGRATASRPYVERLAELAAELSRGTGEASHPLLATPAGDAPVAVWSSQQPGSVRRLNAHVLRTATARLDERRGRRRPSCVFGKKGSATSASSAGRCAQHGDRRHPATRGRAVRHRADAALAGEISAVEVHMRFHLPASSGRSRCRSCRCAPPRRRRAGG